MHHQSELKGTINTPFWVAYCLKVGMLQTQIVIPVMMNNPVRILNVVSYCLNTLSFFSLHSLTFLYISIFLLSSTPFIPAGFSSPLLITYSYYSNQDKMDQIQSWNLLLIRWRIFRNQFTLFIISVIWHHFLLMSITCIYSLQKFSFQVPLKEIGLFYSIMRMEH